MATIGEALVARAKAVSGLYSLIGGATNPRFHPSRLPQNPVYPAVTWQVISEQRRALGTASGHDGLARPRIQITAFAKTRTAAWALSEAVIDCFTGWMGTSAGLVVQGSSFEDRTELDREPSALVWQIPCDFFIWYLV